MRPIAFVVLVCVTSLPIVGLLRIATREKQHDVPPLSMRLRRFKAEWFHPLDN